MITPRGPFAPAFEMGDENLDSWYASATARVGFTFCFFASVATCLHTRIRFGMEFEIFFWYEVEASGEKI